MTNKELDDKALEFVRVLRAARKEQLDSWIETQRGLAKERGVKPFNIGGELSYQITPTTVGVILVVACEATGEKINLTDFSDW